MRWFDDPGDGHWWLGNAKRKRFFWIPDGRKGVLWACLEPLKDWRAYLPDGWSPLGKRGGFYVEMIDLVFRMKNDGKGSVGKAKGRGEGRRVHGDGGRKPSRDKEVDP